MRNLRGKVDKIEQCEHQSKDNGHRIHFKVASKDCSGIRFENIKEQNHITIVSQSGPQVGIRSTKAWKSVPMLGIHSMQVRIRVCI